MDLREALRNRLGRRGADAEAADGATPAGVLVPLYCKGDAWHVLLNRRTMHVGEHKGEIAFPGGVIEDEDADMQACALRETWEEMGIRPEDVDVLGAVDAVLTRTNYLVYPTVGTIPYPYPFKADPREVAEVIEVPLDAILDDAAVRYERRQSEDGSALDRVAYAYGSSLIYGATAWILQQVLAEVRQAIGEVDLG